jgi:predicted nucleic acid-binding Zn ribbon protein
MSSEPRPLRAGLDAVVRSLHSGQTGSLVGVFGSWPAIVGPMIAEHARPVKVDRRTLFVEVDQPAWATQVRFLEADLLTALRNGGCADLTAISVRVAGQPAGGTKARPSRQHGA